MATASRLATLKWHGVAAQASSIGVSRQVRPDYASTADSDFYSIKCHYIYNTALVARSCLQLRPHLNWTAERKYGDPGIHGHGERQADYEQSKR